MGLAFVASAEEDISVAEVSSSMGEYVNIGTRWLVSLAVSLTTVATVLDNASEAAALDNGVGLLSIGFGSGLGVAEGVCITLELSFVVGAGGGIMKEVENTVCGSSVMSGSPSGRTNVIAGIIDVWTVCCMGSTISAVFATTDSLDTGPKRVADSNVGVSGDDKSKIGVED
jgi:hypothetical protein